MNHDRVIKKRDRLARALECAAVPERPLLGRGPLYLVHPRVTAACAPVLREIAAALRDEWLTLDEDVLRAVRTFITDAGSPLLGRDVQAAQSYAEFLCDSVYWLGMSAYDQSLDIAV
jgi:hypothetical protein